MLLPSGAAVGRSSIFEPKIRTVDGTDSYYRSYGCRTCAFIRLWCHLHAASSQNSFLVYLFCICFVVILFLVDDVSVVLSYTVR